MMRAEHMPRRTTPFTAIEGELESLCRPEERRMDGERGDV